MPQRSKVALITGGGSGIGHAVAVAMARKGIHISIADIDDDAGEQTADAIRRDGGHAIYIRADVTDEAAVEDMIGQTASKLGGLDYAVNNAGIEGQPDVGIWATSTEQFEQIMSINVRGVFLCLKHEFRHMKTNGGGAIVNISSIAGLVGVPGVSAYVASKHAVSGLTKTTALEGTRFGIRVNSVHPGVIDTPMARRYIDANPQAEEQLGKMHPLGRMGKPEEVAAAVLWLCSDEASFITGHAMAVDGGYTTR